MDKNIFAHVATISQFASMTIVCTYSQYIIEWVGMIEESGRSVKVRQVETTKEVVIPIHQREQLTRYKNIFSKILLLCYILQRAVVNIQNKGDNSLALCAAAYQAAREGVKFLHPERESNYRDRAQQFDTSMLSYPTQLSELE